MDKKIVLTAATIISCLYCFRFGYILTGYGHGGQLLGIPFALIMISLTAIYFTTIEPKAKEKVFSITAIFFITFSFFSVIVEAIINSHPKYFDFLYLEPKGHVNQIFFACVGLGIIATIISFIKLNKRHRI